jgi:fatty acid desaturase
MAMLKRTSSGHRAHAPSYGGSQIEFDQLAIEMVVSGVMVAKAPSTGGQIRGYAADAREISKPSAALVVFNLGYLTCAWAIGIAAIAVCASDPTWWSVPIAFLIVSSRQQALLNCEHEAVHRKFLPNLRWNNLVGTYLCAAPVGSPFDAARARHLSHHRLVGTSEDPDRELYSGQDKSTVRGLIAYFVRGLTGAYAGMILMGARVHRPTKSASAARELVPLVVAQGTLAVSMTVVFGWWVYPALWLAPLGTLTALCHLIRSFVEHAISDAETRSNANRLITIRSNLAERALVSPYFMNYHAEHHLIPSVPAPRLRALQRRLAARDDLPPLLVRDSYSGALRRYARQLLNQ